MISAKIIADSVSPQGHRLTTFLLTYPRIIHSEFMTHRMVSKNSASSRAIPFEKMVKSVQETPFIPIRWMKEHKGMQGTEYFKDDETFISANPMDRFAHGLTPEESENAAYVIKDRLKAEWLWARDMAVQAATNLHNAGVLYHPNGDTDKLTGDGRGLSKQMCNRLLEPFMYHTVIATASEWQNFFALRAHDAAEIHMQDLAYKMLDAYNTNQPKQLTAGDWHIPFGDDLDGGKLIHLTYGQLTKHNSERSLDVHALTPNTIELAIKVATARCARVSYTEVGVSLESTNYENDIKLHDRLLASGHWSPAEHCAQSTDTNDWFGNFKGWKQYRKFFNYENRTDSCVKFYR